MQGIFQISQAKRQSGYFQRIRSILFFGKKLPRLIQDHPNKAFFFFITTLRYIRIYVIFFNEEIINMTFNGFIDYVDGLVWGVPLMVLILAVGVWLTIRTGAQTFIVHGFKNLFSKDYNKGKGEVSPFAALCTALSATIGTGNIVGVATAICAGGPGALFWMEVAALVGIATKFTECMLSVKYREFAPDGHVMGGPFYYIEKGMGKNWKWLGKLFALFGVLAGLLGIGTITQINGITSAAQNVFDPDASNVIFTLAAGTDSESAITLTTIIVGLIVTICAALVIIGGLKRISKVAEKVVPFMAVLYFVISILLILFNLPKLPNAIYQIVYGAFCPSAVAGGIAGVTIKIAMQKGIARGIFSNEAGLGSAPIAAAAATTDDPVRQGTISMLGTFIDTIVICTLTGLSIVMTDAWEQGLSGAAVTSYAWSNGLPIPSIVASVLLMICLAFFAFTTILGWSYYSERCLEYLVGGPKKIVKFYRILYIAAVFIGPYLTIAAVWNIADIFNGLMAFPNLIALAALSGVAAAEVKRYREKIKK